MAKHRKASNTGRNIARIALAGVVVGAPLAVTGTANAASDSQWDKLAQCEGSGNWSTSTGNGFSGGLQFTPSTWKAYGGTQYASSAASASRDQQIAVAERVLQAQGPNAWPVCSKKVGLTKSSSAEHQNVSSSSKSSSKSESSKSSSKSHSSSSKSSVQSSGKSAKSSSSSSKSYTVQSGDTLGNIAKKYGVNWNTLYQKNQGKIDNPNLITPGQHLSV